MVEGGQRERPTTALPCTQHQPAKVAGLQSRVGLSIWPSYTGICGWSQVTSAARLSRRQPRVAGGCCPHSSSNSSGGGGSTPLCGEHSTTCMALPSFSVPTDLRGQMKDLPRPGGVSLQQPPTMWRQASPVPSPHQFDIHVPQFLHLQLELQPLLWHLQQPQHPLRPGVLHLLHRLSINVKNHLVSLLALLPQPGQSWGHLTAWNPFSFSSFAALGLLGYEIPYFLSSL